VFLPFPAIINAEFDIYVFLWLSKLAQVSKKTPGFPECCYWFPVFSLGSEWYKNFSIFVTLKQTKLIH
jgi:hypothetical protein